MNEWLESSIPFVRNPAPGEFWQALIVLGIWIVLRFIIRPAPLPELPEGAEKPVKDLTSPKIWISQNGILPALTVAIGIVATSLEFAGVSADVLWLSTLLFGVWTVIGFSTAFLRDRFWAESSSFILYAITAFALLSVDDSLIDFLDSMHLPIATGDKPLSVWDLFTGGVSLAIAVWIGLGLSQFIEKRIESIDRINPSTRALLQKVVRVLFIVFALVIGLTSVGINLSALAIFGGAFALGLGFGLQKIVSNLISGFILLSDRSIKPGDVIELEGSYGWINTLRARYVSVITRDGTEHLIPNEDLITQRVVNWTYSNDQVRIRTSVGVSYKEDPHKVIAICIEAAKTHPRVLLDPPPVCLLTGFGDSSVDLELRFWINDPNMGVANVRSFVLLKIWDRFKEEGIEIPFPQRDIHVRSMPEGAEKPTLES